MKKLFFLSGLMLFSCAVTLAQQKGTQALEWLSAEGHLRVEFVAPDVVRTQWSVDGSFRNNNTDVVVAHDANKAIKVKVGKDAKGQWMRSDSMLVRISKTGVVSYWNKDGKTLLLSEKSQKPRTAEKRTLEKTRRGEKMVIRKTADGEKAESQVTGRDTIGVTWRYTIAFTPQQEAIYGLGQHMEDYMNLRGKHMWLCQHNLKAMVPVLTTTGGYGLLFDAGSAMIYDDNAANGMSMQIEAAQTLDYYFMKGVTMDRVVARYRWLTGECPMMPRWLFGYTQSKERYVSSDDLISTLRQFRERHIPIDMIVQDWNYWPDGQWGTMSMNPKYYPNKKQLADEIHKMNAKLMISIWPNATNSPQYEDFRKRGFIFEGTTVYDAFNPEARKLYWQYAKNEFWDNDFDAWWCDSSEPLDGDWSFMPEGYGEQSHEQRWQRSTKALDDALGAERSQLFSLHHAQGIYEGQRSVCCVDNATNGTADKRVVNLTRSSYAGQQRYGTITWNGDTYASWKSFAQMIPAGLNFMATGCPYWSIDVGAFFTKTWDRQWFRRGEYPNGCNDPAYRELYCRMLQFATFLPMMRSHGSDTPREPWRFGNPGEPFYESILASIRLRYQLLPYTYSLAARVSNEGYTMTRALAFDFPDDQQVLDLKDEFMFGPALLVAPMITSGTTRRVYLPSFGGVGGGGWTDFYSNKHYDGGQWIEVTAPIDRVPLFVRDGSILPLGADVEYAAQSVDKPIEVRVYPGRDASFVLYDDAGDGYGQYATKTLIWNNKARKLEQMDWMGDDQFKNRQPININVIKHN